MLFYTSCRKEDSTSNPEMKSYSISGTAQKGPFINGSELRIYELNNEFIPTGRSFHATLGNAGQFELANISLVSPYAEMIADGFYHNEICGSLSDERIELKAMVDLSENKSIHINIMTDLEYERVKSLIIESGYTIQDAKTQAQKEILKVFCLDSCTINNSETLDIIQFSEGDAILLALSMIIQGNQITSEMSRMLADIIADMKTDGEINDTLIKNTLLGNALSLNCDQIKQNLLDIYAELDLNLSGINNFDEYITYFIIHSPYGISTPFEFPESTANGVNVLDPERLVFQMNDCYSFAVTMPGEGNITVRMHKTDGMGIWWIQLFQAYGWNVSQYDYEENEQIFTSILNGVTIDLPFMFSQYGSASVEYYYNSSEIPNITKTITWGAEDNGSDFIFPNESPMGPNLLNMADSSEIVSENKYTVGLQKTGGWIVNFTLTCTNGIGIEVTDGYGIYTYDESEQRLNFTLAGKNEGDYISEIVFNISGKGEINLVSDDLEITEGSYLDRIYLVN